MSNYLYLRLVVYVGYIYPDAFARIVMISLEVVNSLNCITMNTCVSRVVDLFSVISSFIIIIGIRVGFNSNFVT